MGKHFVVFLSWHNSLPGYIKKMYDQMPLNKGFISREHIKPPRLVDSLLMRSSNSYIGRTDAEVISLLKQISPKYIVVWNGDFDDEDRGHQVPLIKQIKENTNCEFIYCEHGWLPQKLTFTIDSQGTNGGSSFSNASSFPIKNNLSPVDNKRKMYNKAAVNPNSGNFIYVPLQLNSDTQIKQYSPYFKDMEHFILHIFELFKGRNIIVKGHPKDLPQNLERYKRLCEGMNNVNFVLNPNNIGYCKHAEKVIAINSTAINEALLYHKPIMTYGKNNFSNKGVTYEVKDINDLEYQKNFDNYQPDKDHIEKYLCYLLSLQFDSTNPNMTKVLKHFKL